MIGQKGEKMTVLVKIKGLEHLGKALKKLDEINKDHPNVKITVEVEG